MLVSPGEKILALMQQQTKTPVMQACMLGAAKKDPLTDDRLTNMKEQNAKKQKQQNSHVRSSRDRFGPGFGGSALKLCG